MSISIVIWNANGLSKHLLEVQTFLYNNNVDILLVSETHFTNRSFFHIPNYKTYLTLHPDGTAHGGSAIIIKSTLKHVELKKFKTAEIQGTSVEVEDHVGKLTVTAIYSPPKHNIKQVSYVNFFKTLGRRFIVGGDYNAKHTVWGSRLITTKGRELLNAINQLKLSFHSTGSPTYWPTDPKKTPDLIDFCVSKGLSKKLIHCSESFDLSSDHSPVFINISKSLQNISTKCVLSNKYTNWSQFKSFVASELIENVSLKTEDEIMAGIEHLTQTIQKSAWAATQQTNKPFVSRQSHSHQIKTKILEKRKLRKTWQQTRYPADKAAFNKISKELSIMLEKDKEKKIFNTIKYLGSSKKTNYSLWRVAKSLNNTIEKQLPLKKPDGSWARTDAEKAELFADHLKMVFKPNAVEPSFDNSEKIEETLNECHQMDFPIRKTTKKEIIDIITALKKNKAPGYDLVTSKILQELPTQALDLITHIFNACLTKCYFPDQWKVAEVKMIPKPGKNESVVQSYRPISLLPSFSKILEILFQKRLIAVVESKNLIPNHQFGFRKNHGTIEQVHRLVEEIQSAFEKKKYCTGVFLDIAQAFDKVWHKGLLYKLKMLLPINFYLFLQSYLSNRLFLVKQGESASLLQPISAGVPQGSILGPILYLLYTSDLPTSNNVITSTFADDTAILSTAHSPNLASSKLQDSLNSISEWLKTWRIKANEAKSVHVTFTLRKKDCPAVTLNNTEIPKSNTAKYLGIHLDKNLNWKTHIFTKRKHLGLQIRKYYWLINKKSPLSLKHKLLLYTSTIKPIWTYGIQLWGTAANSNLEILQRFQNKTLKMIANAPRYLTNDQLQRELKVPTIKEEISKIATKHYNRIQHHPNELASRLMSHSSRFQRLRRLAPLDLQR